MNIAVSQEEGALALILPVHNEENIISTSLSEIASKCSELGWSSVPVVLVENGSSDRSAETVSSLISSQPFAPTLSLTGVINVPPGLGSAYHEGLSVLFKNNIHASWVMLTVLDLPFRFTDLDNFLSIQPLKPDALAFVGSKAHSKSCVDMGILRNCMSLTFRFLRRCLLNMHTKDTQGVIFLHRKLAEEIYKKIESRRFFYTTELIFHIEQLRQQVVEIPVTYFGERRPSSIRPVRDSLSMWRELVVLSRKHR